MLPTIYKFSYWEGFQESGGEKCDSSLRPYVTLALPCSDTFHYGTTFPSEDETHAHLGALLSPGIIF